MGGYTLRVSARARTMRLAVYPDARVVVTTPRLFGQGAIERFVAKHSSWIQRHVEKAHTRTALRVPRGSIPRLKQRALALASARCEHFSRIYGLSYNKITIRAQKTRWGSCSRNGDLSFNYKIAALSQPLAEYIIVHELCHLREMNHSQRFWDLVARTIPAYQKARTELRSVAIFFD